MAGVAGFGPTNAGVKVPCLTAWLYPIETPKGNVGWDMGVEPMASSATN